jgi:hypothetical protein
MYLAGSRNRSESGVARQRKGPRGIINKKICKTHDVWGSTKLRELFPSSLDMLDEMSSIRYIEHPNRAKMITPFVGKQLDICEAFGFAIPEGCAPTYKSRQIPKRKRGRPQKKLGEVGF